MNYIDVKITVWDRIHFADGTNMESVKEIVQTRGIDHVYDDEAGFLECETLYDTQLHLNPNQNDGEATVEIVENDQCIWNNAELPEDKIDQP